MKIKQFSEVILLPEKKDVLRIHLYSRLLQHGIKPFENDIDIILELYLFGGYSNSEEQSEFIEYCINNKYKRTDQSVRNFLSKYTTLGVFEKSRNLNLSINDKFIPTLDCDKLVLQHIISHAE